jgi:hypothetical protein
MNKFYCVRCRENLTNFHFCDKNELDDYIVYGLCPMCMVDVQPDKE